MLGSKYKMFFAGCLPPSHISRARKPCWRSSFWNGIEAQEHEAQTSKEGRKWIEEKTRIKQS